MLKQLAYTARGGAYFLSSPIWKMRHARAAAERVYEPGQVWRYRSRRGEDGSRVVVLRITGDGEDEIVSVCIEGIRIPVPGDEPVHTLSHAPMARTALDRSVTELDGTRETLPDFSDGYEDWKQAFDVGETGPFTIPVAMVIDMAELTMARG